MTKEQLEFIFDTLKEMREDIKSLMAFKHYLIGGFFAISTILVGLIYFVCRIIEVVKL
jgi:hypothetical protein